MMPRAIIHLLPPRPKLQRGHMPAMPYADILAFMKRLRVTLDFSRPGTPTDNAFIEAFDGRFRAECLNAHWFQQVAGSSGARVTQTTNGLQPAPTPPDSCREGGLGP